MASGLQMFTLKDGTSLSIRQAKAEDALALNEMLKEMFGSTDQVLTSPAEFEEKGTLEMQLKRIENASNSRRGCIFIALLEGEIVGSIEFFRGRRKRSLHTGTFGMGVHSQHRNKGVGRLLIGALLDWAHKTPGVEKVKLGVFSTNHRALHLYLEMGFIEEGRSIEEVKVDNGGYVDVIQMYQKVLD